jgi:hypothetical protein
MDRGKEGNTTNLQPFFAGTPSRKKRASHITSFLRLPMCESRIPEEQLNGGNMWDRILVCFRVPSEEGAAETKYDSLIDKWRNEVISPIISECDFCEKEFQQETVAV